MFSGFLFYVVVVFVVVIVIVHHSSRSAISIPTSLLQSSGIGRGNVFLGFPRTFGPGSPQAIYNRACGPL